MSVLRKHVPTFPQRLLWRRLKADRFHPDAACAGRRSGKGYEPAMQAADFRDSDTEGVRAMYIYNMDATGYSDASIESAMNSSCAHPSNEPPKSPAAAA